MRKIILMLPLILTIQSCCFTCWEERPSDYKPISFSRDELNSKIKLSEPEPIVNSGKIYIKDNLLFIGEEKKGFHVFDNSNPESPQKIKFLNILGATDLAIRNNILYINQVTDLVTLTYNHLESKVTLSKRIENTFPELETPDHREVTNPAPEGNVIIDWKRFKN